MRFAICMTALLVLGACEEEVEPAADTRWSAIEKSLGEGVAAVKRRSAGEAVPALRNALDALQDVVRDEWVELLTIAPPGWSFFKPNIQVSTSKASGGETVGEITGTMNGRRESDGTIVIVFVSSSVAHLDSHRRLYGDAGKVEAMRKTMFVETESRDGLRIVRRIYKMRSEAMFLGDHSILTVTIAKEDKALLEEACGWINLEQYRRLDLASSRSRAK